MAHPPGFVLPSGENFRVTRRGRRSELDTGLSVSDVDQHRHRRETACGVYAARDSPAPGPYVL
jgi:hypothetical protein